ncbi:unnamed protein product [Protopolystoma xenopodis]|uniref:Uncharacterized protein n=1 Tax=Protopolystoma xenopodis TaxID=117903 RepID=A0A3S5AR49_9PLAT|nr:unnamed protein product [Protopolystoma xenopodis]
MTDESLARVYRNRRRLPRKQRQREFSSKANRQLVKRNPPSSSGGTDLRPVKPIDSWSRGIRRRLLVEPTFESSRQHESSSKTNRQLVKRNPPSSSGGTDLRISST